MKLLIILGAIASLSLASCGDECSSYSKYSCSQIEAAQYNVYFYYPSGKEELIASVQGLSACQSAARQTAFDKHLNNANWSYVCCMATDKSSCEEKHR